MRVDYLGLEAFVAIADLGSFSKAAAHLNLSQTALSHRIRKIEEDLGEQLLTRTTRDVALTRRGEAALPQLREALRRLADVYGDLRASGRPAAPRVAFACLPTVAQRRMPAVLRDFSAVWPDVEVVIQDEPASRVVEAVQAGEADFGVSIIGAARSDLSVEPLCIEPYLLVVRRDHPLAAAGAVRRRDLEGLPMARIRTQSTNRQLVEEALGEHGARIRWRYEVQNAATAMAMVAAGAAVTVLPALVVEADDAVVGLRFADADISRTLGVLRRRGAGLSRHAERLIALIRARMGDPGAQPPALSAAGAPGG
jgi:DNA-binding transcriptional LysR family regulator